jgi:hypothetical protein
LIFARENFTCLMDQKRPAGFDTISGFVTDAPLRKEQVAITRR